MIVSNFQRHSILSRISRVVRRPGGKFYGYVTGIANLTSQSEAEPTPTFRWLDAENIPLSSGKMMITRYLITHSRNGRFN
jgi:hypothetical protein